MSNNKRQSGFTVMAAILAILVLAVLAFASWYVWHKNHKTGSNKPSNTNSQTNNTQDNPPKQTDPTEGGKYLVITEWGVRFSLPESLHGDVLYGIRKNVLLNDTAPDNTAPVYGDVAYFASKTLNAIDAQPNNCGLRAGAHDDKNQRDDPTSYDGGPGVSLQRSPQSLYSGSEYHVGDRWYAVGKGSAASCYAGSNGVKEGDFIAAIMNALKTVEAVPNN